MINADYTKNLPLSLKLQSTKNRIENSVYINAKVHPLNRFQKEVYLASENNDTLSISAPTSAGKSFILSYILLEQLLNHKGSTIVYIVPTRALISQVEYDLRKLLKEENLPNVNISTVPQHEEGFNQSNIFVFTQERLHWFLTENPLRIDLLLVDEAQKIDDSNRGILLQQKIEEVVKLNSSVRVFFSSPFTSNPELLFENVKNDSSKDVINTQFVAVNQNLIYTSQIPRKPQKWNLTLALLGRTIQLGTLDLKHRPSSEAKKIALIAESHNSKMNLIYSNGAADAEKYSLVLFDLLPKIEISQRVKDLINLVRKTVHPDYALVKVLSKGIAFHYGNMPLLIRQEIEALFKEGDLNYLICTSTLLEGVNLPAKSIFIRKPKRGKNTDLNENDFWNLAGRAGRWGKEFSGNIICIEPTSWKIKPNPNKSKQKISRAIDLIETDKADELVQFIIDGSPREMAETRQDLEFAFGYYYNKFINNELDSNNDFHKKLDKLFKVLKNEITIPNYILVKNPGISPIAQQQLLNYFIKRKVQIENMIPVYPEDSNNLDEYTKLVERIGETISFYHPQLSKSRAILLINWMSGKPLSYLIRKSFESYQRNEKYKNIKKITCSNS
ncbi:DEAD/DEAH box helicase [Flavobacterium sp. J372]|uniref:DEAD/DEAH box helicase n=1 Tax=Flavobacterium sp. J372 TaxID=2898436 RepID=UPI00215086A8|nr:DEAD/DEAH box helicase [Flavobacterium sp. J372]MCR5862973.1 DEAD/DEAH box helicase [Flavobacterium sp. J372]